MLLRPGGIDLFYIDESVRDPLFVATAVRIPFLRNVNGAWRFVWADYLEQAVAWRRHLSAAHKIRARAELHGTKILGHQGLYVKGGRNLRPDEAVALYREALDSVGFIPPASIITTFATDQTVLMGHKGIKAALFGLFQRIRRQCGEGVNGMLFFDDGHPEYIGYYRQATRWLPTGSRHGGWGGGKATANLALDMFPKDANVKASAQSLFLQIADLVAYSASLKLQNEAGSLNAKRVKRGHGDVYDALRQEQINLRATNKRRDGLVPI